MKRTRGAERRKDVTLKSENHYHLCSGAHLPALSSTRGLELPNGATPARAGIQEKLTCYSKRTVIWSPLLVQPPATRATVRAFRARIRIVLPFSYFKISHQ